MNDFFNKTISKIEETVLSYTVIIMAIMLIVGVFMRAVLNSSLTFTEEIAQALLIVISFFGLEYCARKGRHITMSIVFDMVNNKYKKIFMYIISLFSSIAMTYFSYLAFKYVLSVKGLGRVTPALQIPIYLIYSVVPLGFLLGAIEYIRTLILNIKNRDLYLTSEIKVEIDKEIHRDLNNLIDEITENQGKEEV
ncbi:TRAP transporter small permease [Tissierella praeacuta]|uniref:TRAP-type C4-dicarboxylate transport system, small permease component n=1 Tax=Tissierella praeacuta DSM 18095 TaxID=1123404 RepID=A0A1M4V363_9FIRM|nr:TRAP transporter small permease [Tissierella praeacuta]MBU5255099.1 TRAP transporter small permease [Tissierella praeacuta]SHE63416.1 TRAP-type C4-dicarboxylate transport system, small permease component [Tissierella praeacuta DSM 18095]SUP02852.1 TRAP-type C4-dicarboxylate transport system, small permease component [Tissierella praeacuta]